MGVPSFYRWLVNKYPKIVSAAAAAGGGENPSEFDNLYLDMNGIIHPCFHPEDNPSPPTTFEEVFQSMHDYIDNLFDVVRPKKLLFMAIDGVAPRAKMNQQRSRRFRSSKDAQIAEETEEKLRKQFENEGKAVLPKQISELSDSNIITPGTEFMSRLSENLRLYISQRMNENPAWENVKVILSDDKVPGEGEHKIMSFIRAQRATPGYDPNTSHCLYGLDADLIMLALSTHEVHFSILREDVMNLDKEFRPVNGVCESSVRSVNSRGWFKEPSICGAGTAKLASTQEANTHVGRRQSYQYMNVSNLREYLALDLEIPSFEKFEYDLERIIDDFIFICFFAGNDFLPHIPSLEIHEGCIDLLMHVYKKEFQNLGGYLVNTQKVDDKKGGYIKLKRVERFILAVGEYEENIFSKRTLLRDRKLSRILAEYRDSKEDEKNFIDEGTSSEIPDIYSIVACVDELKISDSDTVLKNTKELKQKLKDTLRNQSDLFKDGVFGTDKIKLSTPGWRYRYYKEKFCAESWREMESMRQSVVEKYGEGLCWVLLYYFSGVPSWTWFYPYHYSPFASDFKGFSQLKVKFRKGLPFKPFDQLMGVLPPSSSHALPASYKELMVSEISKIIDLYPTEFEVDVDGKRFLWQGICKLPFIDEDRLLIETKKIEDELKDEEKKRNVQTLHRLILRRSSKSSQDLSSSRIRAGSKKIEGTILIHSEIEGIKGYLHVMHDDLNETDDDDKKNAICMFYEDSQDFKNVPRLLEGVDIPEKIVFKEDIEETILWHERGGSSSSSRNNNYTSQSRGASVSRAQNPPPCVMRGAGRGFSSGRGRAPASAAPSYYHITSNNHVGLFQPSYTRHQSSATTSRWDDQGFVRTSGVNYGSSSNYRRQGADSESWKPRGGAASSGTAGGGYRPINGGRGQGRGRGWS